MTFQSAPKSVLKSGERGHRRVLCPPASGQRTPAGPFAFLISVVKLHPVYRKLSWGLQCNR